jgi:hypothetical protein
VCVCECVCVCARVFVCVCVCLCVCVVWSETLTDSSKACNWEGVACRSETTLANLP